MNSIYHCASTPTTVFDTGNIKRCLRTWERKIGREKRREEREGGEGEEWKKARVVIKYIDFQPLNSIYGQNYCFVI